MSVEKDQQIGDLNVRVLILEARIKELPADREAHGRAAFEWALVEGHGNPIPAGDIEAAWQEYQAAKSEQQREGE